MATASLDYHPLRENAHPTSAYAREIAPRPVPTQIPPKDHAPVPVPVSVVSPLLASPVKTHLLPSNPVAKWVFIGLIIFMLGNLFRKNTN